MTLIQKRSFVWPVHRERENETPLQNKHGEMKLLTSEMKQQQLEWRRAQVLELASEGYSQREIASKLQVDVAAINRDIQFLKQQAKESLQKHIHETVPEEYQKCMIGMKRNLKQTLEIADNYKRYLLTDLFNDSKK